MRKFKLFLLALTGAAILMLGGCKEKQTYDEAAFENDMEPLTDDELKAMDEDMNEVIYEGTELLARAFCHEIDHLDGKMYTDLVEGELHRTSYDEEE